MMIAADLLALLDRAHYNLDGHEHQVLRAMRGPRSPNTKNGRSNGRPCVEKLPLDPLMHRGRYRLCDLARATDTPISVIEGMRRHGAPLHRADQLACRVGLHPILVWGDLFYQSTEAA